VAGGRALDIGCGNGAFLGLLARYGWSVTGVDVSEAASRSAAERGIEVFAGELEDAGLEARSFDYIRMSHSIEHVGDPVRTIGTISDLLRPGGLAYLETPNVASPMARWCGQDWFPLESPRHLWLFDPTTMRRALESNGLEVTKVSTRRFGSRPLSAMTWESTYRREEADGVLLPVRPVLQRSDLPRAVALTAAARLRRLARPDSDEIMSFWARRSPVPT
jgi:SAM-dependent methyltransferase